MTTVGSHLPVGRSARRIGGFDAGELLSLAERAAWQAASLVRGTGLPLGVRRKRENEGIVTSLDRVVEECIREEILAARPDDCFLGEELGPRVGNSGVEWIVDPIDGTNNFVTGLSQWSISIAVRIGSQIVVGVVHLPATGETYTASVGSGARCQGVPISGREGAGSIGDAVVATGFASSQAARFAQLKQLGRVVGVVRDIRCHGAASLEICKVANGQLDGYYESGLNLWDVAAAGLVALEAGVELSGAPWSGSGTLVAARPHLADPLRRLVDPVSGG
ncbi:MAG TPA: inositol monophosphatase family protein [Solirubrobacterales bacterium]|nr:inositol monophosphatase family protein [Solirubrobacterales bacterium]